MIIVTVKRSCDGNTPQTYGNLRGSCGGPWAAIRSNHRPKTATGGNYTVTAV